MKSLDFPLQPGRGGVKWNRVMWDFIPCEQMRGVAGLKKHGQNRSGAERRRSGTRRILVCLALVSAVFVGVLVYPSPYNARRGGIELYGESPEVEAYGPQAPANIVGGYTEPVIQSVVLPEKSEEDATLYVYASEDQKNYHMPTCRYAYASAKKMTLYEAYYLGYTPGKCCDAPAYEGQ